MELSPTVIVRIAVWATLILQLFDVVLLTLLIPRSLHFIKKRVLKIEEWIKAHDSNGHDSPD